MFKRNKEKKKTNHQKLSVIDLGSVALRTVKLLTDFFYIIIILFGMLGAVILRVRLILSKFLARKVWLVR